MKAARNWTQRIFEPGTTFLIRDQVAQDPGFQVSNNRRAAAYAGDIAGSMIAAPLLASTAMQIGAGLYNTAAPEALDIPAEGLANLAALGAMGYGIHRGIARFHGAGGWPGFMGKFGKFADQQPIATPGPKPGPDDGPVPIPVGGPGPQGPVPWGDSPIYARSIFIEDGNPSVPPGSVVPDPGPLPPPFTGIAVTPSPVGKVAREQSPVSAAPATADLLAYTPQDAENIAMGVVHNKYKDDDIPDYVADFFRARGADLSNEAGMKAYDSLLSEAQRELRNFRDLERAVRIMNLRESGPIDEIYIPNPLNVSQKTVRDTEPVVVDAPAQQVTNPTPQELAALAMQKEANRRLQAQMISDSPLSQIPVNPQPVSIPKSVGRLTLADIRSNPYDYIY